MRKYRLATICCLAALAIVSLLLHSGCQDVFYRVQGGWSITVTYDRGEFTIETEFYGDDSSGSVSMSDIAMGEYQVSGNNVTWFTNYTHGQLGAATDEFTGSFDSGVTMSGTGTVTYHDENRTAPITWKAVKMYSFD